MAPSFAASEKGLNNLWAAATITEAKRSEVVKAAEAIIKNRARYTRVQTATGVPWALVGALHWRESSGSFTGCLHNGDKVIGNGRKTTHVPAGRGPFATWEASAIDALKMRGLHKITSWSIARMLFEAERYNGTGYISHKVNSPYLFAATSLQQRGKYVADGKWSSTAWDIQLGVVAILKAIAELAPDALGPVKPPAAPAVIAASAATATAGTVLATVGTSPLLWGVLIGALILIAYEVRAFPKVKSMLNALLANKVTTSAGTAGILTAIATLCTMFAAGNVDLSTLLTNAGIIAVGIVGLFAKDGTAKAA